MPTRKCAVLLNMDCKPLGFIRLKTALSIINQTYNGLRRWVTFMDDYAGTFPEVKGKVYWFDLLQPLNIPEKYLLKTEMVVQDAK